MKPGFLYIISNPAHPNFLKIGVTEDIKARLHTYQTGDPKRAYKVEYYIEHPDAYFAERRIKETIKPFALSIKHEWYEISLSMLISRLNEQIENLD